MKSHPWFGVILWVVIMTSTVGFPGLGSGALVSYWSFDDAANLGADTENASNGLAVGATQGPAAPGGGAGSLSLNGANPDYLNVPNAGSLDFGTSSAFSISAWVNGANQDSVVVGKMISGAPYTGYELHVGSAGPGLVNVWLINGFGSSYVQVNGSSNVLDGAWHQVAMTYDGSGDAAGVGIYVDGNDDTDVVAANSLAANTIRNDRQLNIGSRQNGAAHNFTGMIDEVAVFDHVLGPADMLALYNSGVSGASTAPVIGSLPVPNGSFESPAVPTFNGDAAIWNDLTGQEGVFNNSAGFGNLLTNADGAQMAYLNTAPDTMVFQETTSVFQPGASYELTVGVAARSDRPAPGATMELRLFYRDDPFNTGSAPHVLASEVVSYEDLSDTQLIDFSALTAEIQPGDPAAGKNIGIWLISVSETSNGDWTLDNVRIHAVPEPSSWLLTVLALLGLGGWRRRAR